MSVNPPGAGTPQQQQAPANPPPDDADFNEADYIAWKADPANATFLRKTNREAASYRIRARTAEQKLAALDPTGSGRMTLDEKDQQIRELKIGRALDAASRKHGVEDSELLGAYLDRAGHLKDLDPDAPDFADALSDLVEETVINKPALLGRPGGDVPPTTGARFSAPPPTARRQLTRADLTTMTPEQVDAARSAGLLNELLGRQG